MSKESEVLRAQAALLLEVADSLERSETDLQTMAAARDSAIKARDELRQSIADAESE